MKKRSYWPFVIDGIILFVLFVMLVRCAPTPALDHVEYPPPNCMFLKPEGLPVICYVTLPGESAVVYNGDARIICEDQGPHRWLVIDRKSNEKVQIIGGSCINLVRLK